jgi:hypothetical protein
MSNRRLLTLSLAVVSAFGGTAAHAQEGAPLTRAQVIAELRAALAAGEVPHGDLDISARNGGPDDSPARMAASTDTRAHVAADLRQAEKAGDVRVGDSSRTLAEIDPARYPQPAEQPGLTRAQVVADLHKAERLGDMSFGEEGKTMAEEFPQRYAAARASEQREALAQHPATRLATATVPGTDSPAAAAHAVSR